jgi:hypothetical protein
MPGIQFWKPVALFLVGVLSSTLGVTGTEIPPATGPYNVGVQKLEIPFINDEDPLAPNNVTTSFVATVFYPTHAAAKEPAEQEPYLDPAAAQLLELTFQAASGSLAGLTSAVVRNAPVLKDGPLFPTLVFEGGYSAPTECYYILLSDMASYGYTVFGLDHPYEVGFVRYPNGTGLYGVSVPAEQQTPTLWSALETNRMKEIGGLVDHIPSISNTLGFRIDTERIGTFGHSLGGASAAGAMLRDQRIKSGINIDGTFWGSLAANDSSVDTKRPVFLFSSEPHVPGEVPEDDSSWLSFPAAQTGWWRNLGVNGSAHMDFMDLTFWKEVTPIPETLVGVINGSRMINITRTLVKDFFDFSLLGQPNPVFDDPSATWPDVVLRGTGDGHY